MRAVGDAVQRKRAHLRNADNHVRGDGDALRGQRLADLVGIVAVEDEQDHDPQEAESLEQVVVVVGVVVLLGVGPGMPGGAVSRLVLVEVKGVVHHAGVKVRMYTTRLSPEGFSARCSAKLATCPCHTS